MHSYSNHQSLSGMLIQNLHVYFYSFLYVIIVVLDRKNTHTSYEQQSYNILSY